MNRTLAILVAAIVAVASGLGLFLYVSSVDARAASGEELVTILVADQPIPARTVFEEAFEQELVIPVDVPTRLVPLDAVTDPNSLIGFLAVNEIAAGQFVVPTLFVDPTLEEVAGPNTFARRIPDGRVAITFQAGTQAAVADLIQPGDLVNLLIEVADPESIGLTDIEGPAVVHVFQNLEILAIGQVASNEKGPEAPLNPGGGLYTVLVAADDAARLILLTNQYPVYLALVSPTNEPIDLPPIVKLDALPAGRTPEEAAAK